MAALSPPSRAASNCIAVLSRGQVMSAGKRKVFLFINKAQDQRALTVASVQFIGVYRTDKKVKPLPQLMPA